MRYAASLLSANVRLAAEPQYGQRQVVQRRPVEFVRVVAVLAGLQQMPGLDGLHRFVAVHGPRVESPAGGPPARRPRGLRCTPRRGARCVSAIDSRESNVGSLGGRTFAVVPKGRQSIARGVSPGRKRNRNVNPDGVAVTDVSAAPSGLCGSSCGSHSRGSRPGLVTAAASRLTSVGHSVPSHLAGLPKTSTSM